MRTLPVAMLCRLVPSMQCMVLLCVRMCVCVCARMCVCVCVCVFELVNEQADQLFIHIQEIVGRRHILKLNPLYY